MIYLAAVCMHERSLKKYIPEDAKYFFKKEGAGRQFFILGVEDTGKRLAKTLTKNGCHVSVEDSYLIAREKVEKALKFHKLAIDDESDTTVTKEQANI